MTTTITRIAAGLLVAAGLAVGSAGMAPLAVAETGSNSSRGESSSRTDRADRADRADQRRGSVGLNGNRPQSQPFPKTLDQFKHLPFDPAQPGGD